MYRIRETENSEVEPICVLGVSGGHSGHTSLCIEDLTRKNIKCHFALIWQSPGIWCGLEVGQFQCGFSMLNLMRF